MGIVALVFEKFSKEFFDEVPGPFVLPISRNLKYLKNGVLNFLEPVICPGLSSPCPIYAGVDLPIGIRSHSMVILGLGQAIIGGRASDNDYRKEIYHYSCYHYNCTISLLNHSLEVPRAYFVAIPIPDSTSGCISHSKFRCSHFLLAYY